MKKIVSDIMSDYSDLLRRLAEGPSGEYVHELELQLARKIEENQLLRSKLKHKDNCEVFKTIDILIDLGENKAAVKLADQIFGIKHIGTLEDILYPEEGREDRIKEYMEPE